jgi:hypothetical protein
MLLQLLRLRHRKGLDKWHGTKVLYMVIVVWLKIWGKSGEVWLGDFHCIRMDGTALTPIGHMSDMCNGGIAMTLAICAHCNGDSTHWLCFVADDFKRSLCNCLFLQC